MAHVFISYSRKDIDFARYFRAMLENSGFTVWMDEKRLSAGMNWSDELQKAIDNCGAFVIIMSPDSHESKFVQSEILHAIDHNKAIFPVLLVGQPFFLLKAYQYEDMRGGLSAKISSEFIDNLKQAMGIQSTQKQKVRFQIVEADVREFPCDVLMLKFAGMYFGADKAVAIAFEAVDDPIDMYPLFQEKHVFKPTNGIVNPEHVLYIPTREVLEFTYRDVREFAGKGMQILQEEAPQTTHVAMTVHGVEMGRTLDESESVLAQISGLIDAIQTEKAPTDLQQITIVEINQNRVKRLRKVVTPFFEEVSYAQKAEDSDWAYDLIFEKETPIDIPDAGQSDIKPYAVAITPDDEEREDIFYYGIERPTHSMGLLCERIVLDQIEPDDDMLESKLQRIGQATVMICDVSQITPLLYLQLGYAWGKGVPTVLITQSEHHDFDTSHYIAYQKIWELEERLTQWLKDTL